jgi:hypothetical protein
LLQIQNEYQVTIQKHYECQNMKAALSIDDLIQCRNSSLEF